jgi:hypothetical protein
VLLSSLKTFVVASNKFSGTVNENIYYLPALAKLDLSNNTLVGTTPQAIGCVASTACMRCCTLGKAQAAACMPLVGSGMCWRMPCVCSSDSHTAGSIVVSAQAL